MKIIVEHFYAFQKDLGAPLIQNGVVVGMLVKILSNESAVYINIYKCTHEIAYMRLNRIRMPKNTLPRVRARQNQSEHKYQQKRKLPKKE